MTGSGVWMRRPAAARGLVLALLAAFWVAQLHGVAHGISHLARSAALDALSTPHLVVCAACVGASESGAAPLAERPAVAPVAVRASPAVHAAVRRAGLDLNSVYRSRAPPATPI